VLFSVQNTPEIFDHYFAIPGMFLGKVLSKQYYEAITYRMASMHCVANWVLFITEVHL